MANRTVTEIIPEMIPIREAARRTGLSYSCIRTLIEDKKIVYFRAGRKFLVNWGLLCAFLNGESNHVDL